MPLNNAENATSKMMRAIWRVNGRVGTHVFSIRKAQRVVQTSPESPSTEMASEVFEVAGFAVLFCN